MTIPQAIALFIAALLGGALNSVAGGGSFIAFPALVFTGVPDINANATNTIALWPGSVASVGAYRRELSASGRLVWLGSISMVGGVLGAVLLLRTPPATFRALIPFLLLLAVLLFTFGGTLTSRLRAALARRSRAAAAPVPAPARAATTDEHVAAVVAVMGEPPAMNPPPAAEPLSWTTIAGVSLALLVIATYGGYFGGGIGIMILATLAVVGMENIHAMNALKTFLQTCINGVAVVTFIIGGAVWWPQALVMIGGAIIGGYGGAYSAQRLPPRLVRRFVIIVGFTMTLYFFARQFLLAPA